MADIQGSISMSSFVAKERPNLANEGKKKAYQET